MNIPVNNIYTEENFNFQKYQPLIREFNYLCKFFTWQITVDIKQLNCVSKCSVMKKQTLTLRWVIHKSCLNMFVSSNIFSFIELKCVFSKQFFIIKKLLYVCFILQIQFP